MKRITFITLVLLISSSMMAQTKIGLVLSGGGALGYAHIGAIKALEEHQIYPEYIAGASMGAIIGLFYANGMTPQEIRQMVYDEKFNKRSSILHITAKKGSMGFSSHKPVAEILQKYIHHNSFDSLEKKFYVSVTNLSQECSLIIGSGNKLKEYVLASSSIPVVFDAVEIDNEVYVDGGLLNNFPAEAIRKQCNILIGIDVVPNTIDMKGKKIKSVAERSLNTITHNNSKAGRALCDYVIDCFAIEKYNSMDFQYFDAIFQNGYETMNQYLGTHPELVKACQSTTKNNHKKTK